MPCLSGFELYSRWVPLHKGFCYFILRSQLVDPFGSHINEELAGRLRYGCKHKSNSGLSAKQRRSAHSVNELKISIIYKSCYQIF